MNIDIKKKFYEKIQNTKNYSSSNLPINAVLPFDKDRMNKKIVFVGQNPSNNRDTTGKIFEYDNPSDRVMMQFFKTLGISRDDVYFTNLLKWSYTDNSFVESADLPLAKELFYEEMNIIKPWIVVFISKFAYDCIDTKKLKCPVVCLKHPSYYLRTYGNVETSAAAMYSDLKLVTIGKNMIYDYYIDFTRNYIQFKSENTMCEFIQRVNNLKVVNIDMDEFYRNVMICVSNKKTMKIQFYYHNYCYEECRIGEAEKYTLKGVPCKKLVYKSIKDLPIDKKLYETDIHSDYRLIIDYYDYFETVQKDELNYMTFDIETNKSVDVINTPGEIISIVYLMNNKYEFLYLDNGRDNQIFTTPENTKMFSKERDMIEYFAKIFRESNLVTGFNIAGFDTIYLLNRAKRLGLDEKSFSPLNRVKNNVLTEADRMDESNIKIYGVDVIDTMLYAKDKYFIYALDKPSQYNLDYLGSFLKDKDGKILGTKVHDSRGPYTLWQEDPQKLYDYNIQDVKLCRDIEDYMGLANYLLSFKSLMSTFNIKWSLYNSKIIDFLILCNYTPKYVFPSKGNNPPQELEGGYVKDPISGIYKNVAVFDFASLYPNIIRNFNISYETVYDKSEIKDDLNNYINIDNQFFFRRDRPGILKEVVDKVMFMKTDLSNQMKASDDRTLPVKYNAIKAVINGIYGVFAYRYFRLYDIRVASAITAAGRNLTKYVITTVDSNQDTIAIYGDTDSVFVHIKPEMEYEDAVKRFYELADQINSSIDRFINSTYHTESKYLEMECETIFNRLLQTKAKKKYFGLGKIIKGKRYDTPKEYGRGIDTVKKDTPAALRPHLKKLLMDIVMRETDEDIKKAIREIKVKIYSLPYNELLITKQISRELDEYKVTPQHVKAMKFSNAKLGTDFSRANYKGGMLFVKPNQKYPDTSVIMIDNNTKLPDGFAVDYNKYFELFVKNKVTLFDDNFKKFFSENRSLLEYLQCKN